MGISIGAYSQTVAACAWLNYNTLQVRIRIIICSINLETLIDATPNPKTMEWWKTEPRAWEACRKNLQKPEQAMKDYCRWLEEIPGNLIFVGHPMVFDFRFIDYYLYRFVGRNPFGYATVDIRSYIMGMNKINLRQASIEQLPKRLLDDLPHTHIALDDAIEQGALFCNLLAENHKIKIKKLKKELTHE